MKNSKYIDELNEITQLDYSYEFISNLMYPIHTNSSSCFWAPIKLTKFSKTHRHFGILMDGYDIYHQEFKFDFDVLSYGNNKEQFKEMMKKEEKCCIAVVSLDGVLEKRFHILGKFYFDLYLKKWRRWDTYGD